MQETRKCPLCGADSFKKKYYINIYHDNLGIGFSIPYEDEYKAKVLGKQIKGYIKTASFEV